MHTQLLRVLFVLLAAIPFTWASSLARTPLRLLSKVSDSEIHTRTGRIKHHSEFDLTFTAFNGHRKIKFTLEPNDDVISPEASINHMDAEGRIYRSEPFKRHEHKIFKGVAKQQHGKDDSWVEVGWARINILQDGDEPIFEGAFTVNHDAHHIQTRTNYIRTKHIADPGAEEGSTGDYMVIWRDSDVTPQAPQYQYTDLKRSIGSDVLYLDNRTTCSSDNLEFNTDPQHPIFTTMLRRDENSWGVMPVGSAFGKRQIDSQPGGGNGAGVSLVSTIGNSAGCPNTKRVALVGVATDCTYTKSFSDQAAVTSNIVTQMNSASSVWESSFNISLGLQNVTISNSSCPGSPVQATLWNQDCNSGLDIQARLNYFSGWRGTLQDQNSHWTLLSTCNTGAAVGLAWLGQACVHGSNNANTSSGGAQTVSGANVVVKTSTEWQVIAHETGHTYGAVHDCTPDTCADQTVVSSSQCCPLSNSVCDAGSQYIMNPYTVDGIKAFSPCTVGNICSAIGRNAINTDCLSANKGVVTVTGQVCGNGIVEQGEDCDCGGVQGCGNNPCCDAQTCKFKTGAVCDDSNEDCCTSCQFSPATTVCRASAGVCDPAERCTGSSPTCPKDATLPDGSSCTLPAGTNTSHLDTSALRCASGQCTSRDLQCQTLMGVYTRGSNDTYACDSTSCTLSCASPAFGTGTCYGLQQNLLDGTPCGGGGHCANGVCAGSTFGGQVKSWVNDHKGLVIGVAVGVGVLLLLALGSCLAGVCGGARRSRRKPPVQKGVSPNGSWYSGGVPPGSAGIMGQAPGSGNGGSRGGVPPPPPMMQRTHSGYAYQAYRPVPPPVQTGGYGQGQGQGWAQDRGATSPRYA